MNIMIVAVEESDSTVGFYDPDSGAELARIRVGTWPHEIAVDAAGATAYVTNFGIKDYDEHIGKPGASISVLDLKALAERERFFTFTDDRHYVQRLAPHSVLIDEKRNRLLVNVEGEDTLIRFDLGSPEEAQSFLQPAQSSADGLVDATSPLPPGTHAMLLSPDGDRLYVGCGPGGLFEVDADKGDVIRGLNCGGPVRGLAFTVDGKRLIVSAGGTICLVDPATFTIERRFSPGGPSIMQFLYPTPTPDGRYILVPAVWEGQLLRIDIKSGEAERIIVGADPIHLVIPPDSDVAYLGHGRSRYIAKINWKEFREVGRIVTHGGPNGIAWAPLAQRAERATLRVGAAIPLSGPSRSEGQDLRLGYQFWAEHVNEAGGLVCNGKAYQVEVLFEDTRSVVGRPDEPPLPDGTPTREHLEKLANDLIDAGAIALLGTYPSPPHFALRDIATAREVPLITASGAAGEIYSAGSAYVFGIMTAAKGFLNESFDLLSRQSPRPRNALFVSCQDNAAWEDAETTATYITSKLGIDVIGPGGPTAPIRNRILRYNHNATDFDAQVRQIVAFAPDVLAITGHLSESIAITRELAAQGVVPQAILFSVGPAMPAFPQTLGPLSAHLMGSAMWSRVQGSHGHDRYVTPEAYRDAFFDRFSKEPSHLAAGATACGGVIEEAIRRARSLEPKAIAAALRNGFSMRSFYSPIVLDQTGLNAGRDLLTIQLRGADEAFRPAALWPAALAGGHLERPTWPFPGWPSEN